MHAYKNFTIIDRIRQDTIRGETFVLQYLLTNEFLWFLFLVCSLFISLFLYRVFGKQGLYIVIVSGVVLANIQVIKLVDIFGFTATLGNILYGSVFFATDVLNEIYGKKEARKGVMLGFAAMIVAVVYMQFALVIRSSPLEEAQRFHDSLSTIFSVLPRIVFASTLAYLFSQLHDVWAYQFWRRLTSGKHLWLRNNASTFVSQFIDSVIFTFVAFWGVYDLSTWFQIVLTTYVFKWIVAAVDTPFLYAARRLSRSRERTY